MAEATTDDLVQSLRGKAAEMVDDIQRKLRDDLVVSIVDKIEGGNVGSWLKPWDGFCYVPHNRLTGNAYKGGNVLVLLACGAEADMGRFATFKQWNQLGFSIIKGSTSIPLVNWSERWLNCDQCKAKTGATWAKGNRKCCPDAVGTRRLAPKYFRVFGAVRFAPPLTTTEPSSGSIRTTRSLSAGIRMPRSTLKLKGSGIRLTVSELLGRRSKATGRSTRPLLIRSRSQRLTSSTTSGAMPPRWLMSSGTGPAMSPDWIGI